MTITNHMLAGSIIGLAVDQPAVVFVLAFASHFAMDALPHFGYAGNKGYGEALKHRLSFGVSAGALLLLGFVTALLIINHEWLALAAGLVAVSPDILGLYNYLAFEKRNRPPTRFVSLSHIKFHRAIQRYERPWGIWVELLVFVPLFLILINLL